MHKHFNTRTATNNSDCVQVESSVPLYSHVQVALLKAVVKSKRV